MPTHSIQLNTVWVVAGLLAWLVITIKPEVVISLLSNLVQGVGAIFRLPAWVIEQVKKACQKLLDKTLRWEGDELDVTGHWKGLMVISRLVYFVIAVVIISATTILDLKSLGIVLYGPDGGGVDIKLPVSVGFVTGLLTFGITATYGCLLLEVLDVLPSSVAIYPNPKPKAKRLFGWVAGIGSGLTLVMVTLIFVDRQIIAGGGTWDGASIMVSAFQGLLANGASVIAFWTLVLGVVALVSLLSALAVLLCEAIRLPLVAMEWLLAYLAEEVVPWIVHLLAMPLRLLWNLFAWVFHLPRFHISLPGPANLQESETETGGGSAGAGGGVRRIGGTAEGGLSEEEELVMQDQVTRQRATVMMFGTNAERMGMAIVERLGQLRGATALRAVCRVPLDRLRDAHAVVTPLGANVHDVSLVQAHVVEATTRTSDQREIKANLAHKACENVVRINPPGRHHEGQLLIVLDVVLAPLVQEALLELHDRLRGYTKVVLAMISEPVRDLGKVHAGLQTLKTLYESGAIATSILVFERSELATGSSAEQQERLLATGLGSALIGHAHDPMNPTFAELMEGIGVPFAGAGLISRSVIPGAPVTGSRLLRIFGGPQRGIGNPADIRNQVMGAMEDLLAQSDTHTVPSELTGSGIDLLAIIATLPLKLRDPRFKLVVEELRAYFASTARLAEPCFVSGDGTKDTQLQESYYIQDSGFFAVPEEAVLGMFSQEAQMPPASPQGEPLQLPAPKRRRGATRGQRAVGGAGAQRA